ncbi:MAG: ATP-binding protein [Firmicutes bacterium]|nr:ATP-binding protein [Bacillota bacterium]
MAAFVVAIFLFVSAYGLIYILKNSVENQGGSAARLETQLISSLIQKGDIPFLLPVGQQDLFAQIVTYNYKVIANTPNVSNQKLLVQKNIISNKMQFFSNINQQDRDQKESQDADGPYMVMVKAETIPKLETGKRHDFETAFYYNSPSVRPSVFKAGKQKVYILVAVSLASGWDTIGKLESSLFLGVPILVVLVAGMVLWLTAKALAPVREIREEVAEISLSDLHRRVPEPKSKDEVARLAKTMNKVLDRLESSAFKQRRFVADASHELRTPLATLATSLDVALAHPENVVWEEAVSDALVASRRLSRIVDELLLLAQIDEGGLVISDSSFVDLDDLVLEEVAFAIKPDKIKLDLSKLSAGRILGDKESLRRVIANLLDNAYKYGTSRVDIAVFTEESKVIIEVSDDGPGIEESARELIFMRFTRLDDARSSDKGGAGLGLSLVKEIVATHGGQVYVQDSPNLKGACFVLEFPAG